MFSFTKITVSLVLFLAFADLFSRELLFEARASYFYPTASETRDTYGCTGLYSLESSYSFCSAIYGWSSVGYLYDSGKVKSDYEYQEEKIDTSMTYVPLATGLKYIGCLNCFRPYLGAGLLVSYLHTKDDSPFVVQVRNKWGVGAVAKAGVLYDFFHCFFIDMFLDYYWMKINFNDTDKTSGTQADISGLSLGAGIGYRF